MSDRDEADRICCKVSRDVMISACPTGFAAKSDMM